MYAANGDRVDPKDVLDDEEYASYRRRRSDNARLRLIGFARTGILPPAVRENTEEAALDAYERQVAGS